MVPQVPYAQALAIQKGANALLYVQWEPGGEKATYSKFAQYMGAHRPILALAPTKGEADRMLEFTGVGSAARDNSDTADILRRWLAEYREAGEVTYAVDEKTSRSFSYREKTARLAGVLDEISGRR